MYGKKNENLIFGFVQTCYALKTVIFFGKKVSNHFILGNFSGFQGFSGLLEDEFLGDLLKAVPKR